jgi:hypothetical protein
VSGATLDLAIFRPTAEFQEELWARRADWLPADASRDANAPNTSAEAMARLSERAQSFVGTEVMDFIARARAARV